MVTDSAKSFAKKRERRSYSRLMIWLKLSGCARASVSSPGGRSSQKVRRKIYGDKPAPSRSKTPLSNSPAKTCLKMKGKEKSNGRIDNTQFISDGASDVGLRLSQLSPDASIFRLGRRLFVLRGRQFDDHRLDRRGSE